MVASGSPTRWGGGKVTVTMIVLKPGDGSCCPTGHKLVGLSLR